MKKIIFSLLLTIFSVTCFGQINNVYISNKHGVNTYHIDSLCPKNKHNVNSMTISNISIKTSSFIRNYHPCITCVTKNLNDSIKNIISYNNVKNINPMNIMMNAGKYQKKSANYRGTSLGLFLGGAAIASIPAITSMDDDTSYICFGVAGALGIGALVSEIISINYQFKSGKNLSISATKIQYTF